VHLWAEQGVLVSDQRVSASKVWVRVEDADLTRLNGSIQCDQLPTVADVKAEYQITRDEVWALVRARHYLPYRVRNGKNWEWRLEQLDSPDGSTSPQGVVSREEAIGHYE
jgi:hypothetical protein